MFQRRQSRAEENAMNRRTTFDHDTKNVIKCSTIYTFVYTAQKRH